MHRFSLPALLLMSTATLASAEAPSIVTDIAPVHGLVSMVAGDLTEPALLIEPKVSPHTNAMRPSAAAALQEADVVFWMGAELTPWLEAPLANLAGQAVTVALLDVEGTQTLDFRETEDFGAHDHAHGDDHGHDHDHDHDHAAIDPHAWLDPANAGVWLTQIADTLSERDPGNAATYRSNADAALATIAATSAEARTALDPLKDRSFIVFHDAYHYFESRFGIEASGALSLSDAVPPSPARVAAIQQEIRDENVVCVFSEPQFSEGLVRTVIDGTEAKTGQLDPLGANLPLGADFYPALIRDMATRFADCLQ